MKLEVKKSLQKSRKAKAIDGLQLPYVAAGYHHLECLLDVGDWAPIEARLRAAGFKVVPMTRKRKR